MAEEELVTQGAEGKNCGLGHGGLIAMMMCKCVASPKWADSF
jgi:hypothetical protein